MSQQKSKQLRLRAQDQDDLGYFSTILQDALIASNDIKFDAGARRFAIAANRFRWERQAERKGLFRLRERPTRIRTIVRFDYVSAVKSRGFDETSTLPLNLLSITAQPEGKNTQVLLAFSSGIDIALECETLDATLDDVSAPWNVEAVPNHKD